MIGNIDDIECETALREISVTSWSTGANASSTADEPADQSTVAGLRPSVTSIATLTPGRLAGGFGVRIAWKRSPIDLSFLSPAVAPFDDEPVDDPELSIVSPSPFARLDDRDDAFTYLTVPSRSDRAAQSVESVGVESGSATQATAERMFRSDRRSHPRQSQSPRLDQPASRRRDALSRWGGTRRRGNDEPTGVARSDADTPSVSRVASGRTPDRSGSVDEDRTHQRNVRDRSRQQDRRSRTVATRVTWADAITGRSAPDSSAFDSRRPATSSDTAPSSRSESLERETPSRLVSKRSVEQAKPGVTAAAQPDLARGKSGSSPALVTRTAPSADPAVPPSDSPDTGQRPVRRPDSVGRRPSSSIDSRPVPAADDSSIRDLRPDRDSAESGISHPADTRTSTAASAETGASKSLQQSWTRTDTRSRTQTATSGRDSDSSSTPSRHRTETGTANTGSSPIRAASRPNAVRSDTTIGPTVEPNGSCRLTETNSSDRLKWSGDTTAPSAVLAEVRARISSRARFDERVGYDSASSRSQSTEPGAAESASASMDRRPSGSDRNRAVTVQSHRSRRHWSTPITTGTDRIPRRLRVASTASSGIHDGKVTMEPPRPEFASRESRASTRNDRTSREPAARGIAPPTATPPAAAPTRAVPQRLPPLELSTDARGTQAASGQPRSSATDHRSTAYQGSIAGQPSPRSQQGLETDPTPTSDTSSSPSSSAGSIRPFGDSPAALSIGVTSSGRVRAAASAIHEFSSSQSAGDRRTTLDTGNDIALTETHTLQSRTGRQSPVSSSRSLDRGDGMTGTGRVSSNDRRSEPLATGMQSGQRRSELVVDQRTAESVQLTRVRPSNDNSASPLATAARTNSGGSDRRESISAGTDTLPLGSASRSAASRSSRRDDLRSPQALTRIDSLRSIAATRPTEREADRIETARLSEQGSTEPRRTRPATHGSGRSHRSRQGSEAVAHPEISVGSVRSSQRDHVTADSPNVVARTRFSDGQTRARSLERGHAVAASGAMTAASGPRRSKLPTAQRDRTDSNTGSSNRMPVLRMVSDHRSSPNRTDRTTPSESSRPGPSHSTLRSGRPNPNATVGVVASRPATRPSSVSSSHMHEPARGDRNGDGRSHSRPTEATARTSDSSRTQREQARETWNPPFRGSGPSAEPTAGSATNSISTPSTGAPPSEPSVSTLRTQAERGDQSTVDSHVRETTDGKTQAPSTITAVSPSRVTADPRRTARSEPIMAGSGAEFGSMFDGRSVDLRYRSPAVTDSTASRLLPPRDDNSPVTAFDHSGTSHASLAETNLRSRPSIADGHRTHTDRSISGQNSAESASRDRSRGQLSTGTATGSTEFDSQAATDPISIHRLSRGRRSDTAPSLAPSRPRSSRRAVEPDANPITESDANPITESDANPITKSDATVAAEATGVAMSQGSRTDRRTPLSVLRTTASRSSSQSHTDRQSVHTGFDAASASDGVVSPSDQRPARPPTVVVRSRSPTERADASPAHRGRDHGGAADSRRGRVAASIDGSGDDTGGIESISTSSIRPSVTDAAVSGNRQFESSFQTGRRLSTGRSATDRSPDGTENSRGRIDSPSLTLPDQGNQTDASASPGRSRVANVDQRNKPTTNTIESTDDGTGVNGMQTSAVSERPSLTYRRSSATDVPTVDRGGPNQSNAESRDSTTASRGASRESTSNRAISTHDSGRERRRPSDQGETDGNRALSGFGSESSSEPPLRGSPVGHDDVGSGPNDRQRSSIDRPEQPSERRSEPSRGRPGLGHHSRNRFDSVDLSSGTDPRFDADVDRAVQELYRKLERKIRVERDRRGL